VYTNFNSNTISVVFENASGLPASVLSTDVQAPIAVGVADFNNDSKLDLAVSHGTANNPQFVAIFLGDGVGGFGARTDFAVLRTKPLVTADFTNDGNVDIFIGSSTDFNSQMMRGDGAGGFMTSGFIGVTNNSQAVARDLNNDGKIDLVTTNNTNSISVQLGFGHGSFDSPNSFPISRATFVAVADFNSDGKLDLVAAGQNDGVSILFGNGTGGFGGFGAPISFSTGYTTTTVAAGDFNGDGKADVVTTGGNVVSLFIGDGNGNLGSRTDYLLNQSPVDLQLGDFDGDGKLDVATGNAPPSLPPLGGAPAPIDRGTILFGDGTGKLRFASLLTGNASALINGDVNQDGKLDLITGNTGQNDSLLLGDGLGGFGPPIDIPVGTTATPAALGDLNGDGILDLVAVNSSSNAISTLLGNGSTFGPPSVRSVPGFNPSSVVIEDFNNDGKPDLGIANRSSSFISVLLGNGAGGFGSALNSAVPSGGQQIVAGDFNGDGKTDVAVPHITGLSVLLGNGNGTFGAPDTIPTTSTATSVGIGDFNGDGNADLAFTVGNNKVALVYAGDGHGNFPAATASLKTGGGPSSIVVADYNGDGNSDLVTGNSDGNASVLLGNGAGTFVSGGTHVTGGGITRGLTTGDFNSDGRLDLAFANSGGFPSLIASSNLSIVLNICSAAPVLLPTLAIDDTAITEGDDGSLIATFNVTLSAASSQTVSVSFYSADKDAVKALDYQATLGRLTFAPGVTSQTISIRVNGDSLDEFDEQFRMILAFPLNAGLADAEGVATILDNDPPPTISISDMSLPEGDSGTHAGVFTVSLSKPSGKPISVDFATSDGTAASGTDYVGSAGNVNFAAGEIAKTIGVAVNGDTANEPDETFFVTLTNPQNVVVARGQASGLIINDDTPTIQLSASTYSPNEGAGSATITLNRTGDPNPPATVKFATSDTSGLTNCGTVTGAASERCDYVTSIGTVSFASGETSKSFTIPLVDDVLVEGNETFTVTLSNVTGGQLGTPSTATVTIVDNDSAPATSNPIDGVDFFVRQQYLDILGRQPDQTGFQNWVNTLSGCPNGGFGEPATSDCDRLHVAAGFFQSDEFLNRGYWAFRFYMVAFNQRPTYAQFIPDMSQVGGPKSPAEEESSKVLFADAFVQRSEFLSKYGGLSGQPLADALTTNAGLPAYTAAGQTNGQILRAIAERQTSLDKFLTEGTVSILYFGFQRRDPDAIGYQNNINTLNADPNNLRHMIFIFIYSTEYRGRFGPP
jgi:hypothetical protein